MIEKNKFSSIEVRTIIGVGITLFLRMIGMFMIMPVLNSYSLSLNHSNKILVGIAIGIYGFFQAIFQIPFGFISDYIGRKHVIIIGLLFLLCGSLVTSYSVSIWGLIIGRAIQGSGAVTSTSMALLADIIDEKKRAQAMGVIGIVFSVSFAIAMIASPIVVDIFGPKFIFSITSFLSVIGIIITLLLLPSKIINNSKKIKFLENYKILKNKIKKILCNKQLLKINFCVLFLHILLMFNFVSLPRSFELCGYLSNVHWKIYFFTITFAFISMSIILRKLNILQKKTTTLLLICVFLIFLSASIFLIAFYTTNIFLFIMGLQLFLLGFTLIEVILPFLVSRKYFKHKGTAMGVYSSVQFLGIAIGGSGGGWLHQINTNILFIVGIIISIIWLLVSFSIKKDDQIEKKLNKSKT